MAGVISSRAALLCICIFAVCSVGSCDDNEKWKKKDVRDYTDADLERLFEQWEDADEDELEEDELPEWKRPKPKIDLSHLNSEDPEAMLRMTKQGQTLMMFITVSGNPTEDETQTVSQIWQSGLFNANVEVQRYVVGEDRVLFVLKDGSKAWEIKDYLITQERCKSVTIEGKDYIGAGHEDYKAQAEEEKPKKKKKGGKKKKKTEESKKEEEKLGNEANPNKKAKTEL